MISIKRFQNGGDKMAYFNTCPDCGSNLDPGENCDCRSTAIRRRKDYMRQFKVNTKTGQIVFGFAMDNVGKNLTLEEIGDAEAY
jgi:hypothetical protein